MRTEALERAVRRAGSQRARRQCEPCALCAVDLPEVHPHLFDTGPGLPLCACRACSLLFDRAAASDGRYRLIPTRRVPLMGITPARLRVPVGLAFFVTSDDGDVQAHYPSPAGATRWLVDTSDWEAALADCPNLSGLVPEVEALLVNTVGGRSEAWIVPVTDCYRLVAVVVQTWQGLSGGSRVWEAIEGFFDELRSNDGTNSGR